jgi:predicted dehydrogenase
MTSAVPERAGIPERAGTTDDAGAPDRSAMPEPGASSIGVGVIGCGLIGSRRAGVAAAHASSSVRVVADIEPARAESVAAGRCDTTSDWQTVLERTDIDAVVVATSNDMLAEVSIAALGRGKHVLLEKPMGRSFAEAQQIAAAAAASGRVLRVGFNHRFHPALARAAELVAAGATGRPITVRARYGHGGRPGLEKEWRSDAARAGGGELMDQGVHLADLFHWMLGMPVTAFAVAQTAVWPIAPLEDNAFGLLTFGNGAVAQLHVSMTQWKNLFSLELHGERGAIVVEGLGGSYGVERLTIVERAMAGGVPVVREDRFEGEDLSWQQEWNAFMTAVEGHRAPGADAGAGLAAMRIIDALYRSAQQGTVVQV